MSNTVHIILRVHGVRTGSVSIEDTEIFDGSETAKNSISQPDSARSDRRTQVQRSSVQVESKESSCVPEKSLKLSYSFSGVLYYHAKKRILYNFFILFLVLVVDEFPIKTEGRRVIKKPSMNSNFDRNFQQQNYPITSLKPT